MAVHLLRRAADGPEAGRCGSLVVCLLTALHELLELVDVRKQVGRGRARAHTTVRVCSRARAHACRQAQQRPSRVKPDDDDGVDTHKGLACTVLKQGVRMLGRTRKRTHDHTMRACVGEGAEGGRRQGHEAVLEG